MAWADGDPPIHELESCRDSQSLVSTWESAELPKSGNPHVSDAVRSAASYKIWSERCTLLLRELEQLARQTLRQPELAGIGDGSRSWPPNWPGEKYPVIRSSIPPGLDQRAAVTSPRLNVAQDFSSHRVPRLRDVTIRGCPITWQWASLSGALAFPPGRTGPASAE